MHGSVVEPTLHALVVTPVVGGVVLMFFAVGIMALALGALSGFAASHRARRHSAP